MGLNGTLQTSGRSLEIFTAGIQVASQNIANANTPGYIREEIILETNAPFPQGQLIFGTGVDAQEIQQSLDFFLETRILDANGDISAASQRSNTFLQLEVLVGELGERDISTGLNEFLGAINNFINEPETPGLREQIIGEGVELADTIQSLSVEIDRLRGNATEQVDSLVNEANELIDEVSGLNKQILRLEAAGLLKSQAGGLRSQRLTAINRLSEIIPIEAIERETGVIDLSTGNNTLITTGITRHLQTVAEVDRGVQTNRIQIEETGLEISVSGGEIRGLIEGRDEILGGFADTLDQFTSSLIHEFNRIHASGEGTQGYESITGTYAVEDVTATLEEAGLAFAPEHGSFQLKVIDQQTGQATTSTINIDLDGIGGNDTTLNDLQAALDAVDGVTASITTDGRLQLEADAGSELRFANDTSGVLAALGINTFFTGESADDIAVQNAITTNPALFAGGFSDDPADNRNAIALARFIENPIDALGDQDLDGFYNTVISNLAQSSASEAAIADGFGAFRDSLLSQKEQISGVSLDEETIKLIEFQQAYTAASRVITTVNELFNVLLSI